MTLRLDPRLPLVWRSPFSAQIGVDPARVHLNDLTEAQERMLAALSVGVSLPGLAVICGGDLTQRDALLDLLAPVLRSDEKPTRLPVVAVSGTHPVARQLATLLAASDVQVILGETVTDLDDAVVDAAVVVGAFVLPPATHSSWLRRDVPHLPVVASDTGVTVGPMIEPGTGACLLCLELHHRDADPAWPAIATQLLGRAGAIESALVTAEAAVSAARLVLRRLGGADDLAESVRIDAASGEQTARHWHPHPECGCRGISHLVAVGSAT